MEKTDRQLKQDVETELRWDPQVNSAQIGVAVEGGEVTLLGAVDTYPQRWAAEVATKRVSGVRTVTQDLTIKLPSKHQRSDTDIAEAAKGALSWDVFTPSSVTAVVKDGEITLGGEVDWNFERDGAERSVRHLIGVTAVQNRITLRPHASTAKIHEKIQSALQRQARADSASIEIETLGSRVTLTGHASSWRSIEDAAGAAWAAPGVTDVIVRIKMQ
jgi:osmotically-inducible protein OsmY